MTDTKLLIQKMDESGYKRAFVAERCGLTYQGLMNKVNGKYEFTAPEIKGLRILLKLSLEEAEEIFFASDVDK